MDAQLILENGARFFGKTFGAEKDIVGEIVFTTGMTGYQETLTDPSYAGQIVTMTFPLIGNYGINLEDMEAKHTNLKAFVVREKCDFVVSVPMVRSGTVDSLNASVAAGILMYEITRQRSQ